MKWGIFQPAMLVFWSVTTSRNRPCFFGFQTVARRTWQIAPAPNNPFFFGEIHLIMATRAGENPGEVQAVKDLVGPTW